MRQSILFSLFISITMLGCNAKKEQNQKIENNKSVYDSSFYKHPDINRSDDKSPIIYIK